MSRTIRLRSYKYFEDEQFLSDIAELDWLDVLACPDLDVATEIFTNKFKSVLDLHAPWIVFQQRKFYKPWISQQTVQLMNERDKLKKEAIALSNQNSSRKFNQEETDAWKKFRVIRNKINNTKKNEAYMFKRQVFEECSADSRQTWNNVKRFMDWKESGSPHQIVVNNKMYRKANEIAIMSFLLAKLIL